MLLPMPNVAGVAADADIGMPTPIVLGDVVCCCCCRRCGLLLPMFGGHYFFCVFFLSAPINN
jgi:hypothetical protein